MGQVQGKESSVAGKFRSKGTSSPMCPFLSLSDHAVANTWWDPKSLPSWLTEEYYVQKIQPLLRGKKVREIAELMQVSQPYAAFIRSGRRRPHPRHWQALAELVGISNTQMKRGGVLFLEG
jgi:hypothetical protein